MNQSKEHRIEKLCVMAKISRSGYYEWVKRPESTRDRNNRRLLTLVKVSYRQSDQTYGAIRVHRDLQDQGEGCSKNRIARLMQLQGLKSVHRKKYQPQTTDSKHAYPIAPNVIAQDFTAKGVNQKWGSDISYIRTDEGWLYKDSVELQQALKKLEQAKQKLQHVIQLTLSKSLDKNRELRTYLYGANGLLGASNFQHYMSTYPDAITRGLLRGFDYGSPFSSEAWRFWDNAPNSKEEKAAGITWLGRYYLAREKERKFAR